MSHECTFQSGNIMQCTWLSVPVILFAGIIIAIAFINNPVLGYAGVAGCVIASFALALIAYFKPKKDIVALIAPVYALVIFNPWSEFSKGLAMQIMYAVTLLVITWRLEKKFS